MKENEVKLKPVTRRLKDGRVHAHFKGEGTFATGKDREEAIKKLIDRRERFRRSAAKE